MLGKKLQKKILIVANNLFVGGITSYLVHFTNYLCESGHSVSVLYFNADDECLEQFKQGIRFIKKKKISKLNVLIRVMCSKHGFRFVQAALGKKSLVMTQIYSYYAAKMSPLCDEMFDVAVSSEEFFCNYYLTRMVRVKRKIGWIHPDYHSIDPMEEFEKTTFRDLDHVAVVSETNRDVLVKEFPEYSDKFVVIENILDSEEILHKSEESIDDVEPYYDGVKLVTVCRIDNSSKRLQRVISTSNYLKEKNVKFHWYIVGGGKDFSVLNEMIQANGVSDCVFMLGSKKNPYPYMKYADFFVLVSRYEGKPITVEEAKILHCPVIVTNYRAAHEQVPIEYGVVIDNDDVSVPEQIYQAICSDLVSTLKNNLSNYKYDADSIYKIIDKIIIGG